MASLGSRAGDVKVPWSQPRRKQILGVCGRDPGAHRMAPLASEDTSARGAPTEKFWDNRMCSDQVALKAATASPRITFGGHQGKNSLFWKEKKNLAFIQYVLNPLGDHVVGGSFLYRSSLLVKCRGASPPRNAGPISRSRHWEAVPTNIINTETVQHCVRGDRNTWSHPSSVLVKPCLKAVTPLERGGQLPVYRKHPGQRNASNYSTEQADKCSLGEMLQGNGLDSSTNSLPGKKKR